MKKMIGFALLLTTLCGIALASGTTRTKTDEITSSDGGATSFPAGFAVSAGNGITNAGPLVQSGAATLSGVNTLSGATTASGGLTVPTAAATGAVHSFTAALTLTAGTNVAAVVTPTTFQYFQLGKSIMAYGQASIDPTSDDTDTVFTLSLPVARINFTAASQGTGTATKAIGEGGRCQATNSAQTMTCSYFSNGTAVELVDVWFVYTLP